MYATQFLNRLGLDHDADERAIKRAYARELKLIDQGADIAGFQALREAYEAALYWVKHKPAPALLAPEAPEAPETPVTPVAPVTLEKTPAPAAPAAASPSAPPREADTGPSAQQLAQAVFDELLGACAQLAAQGDALDSAAWRKALQRSAGDERLLNLSAHANFEYLIARLLTAGWRPGHEALFIAARQVFGWDRDRRRLMDFGQAGAWLNQAIDECEMFTRQRSGDCSGQAEAIARLRDDARPGKRELLTHVPHLRTLAARFPAWTAIVADSGRIEQWIELEGALPAWRRRMRALRLPGKEDFSSFSWWQIWIVLLLVRALYSWLGPSRDPAPVAELPAVFRPSPLAYPGGPRTQEELRAEEIYKRAASSLYIPPGMRPLPPQPASPAREAAAPAGRALNDAEMKAIAERIDFRIPHAQPRTYKVEFNIELDEHGAIRSMTKKTSSGVLVLDARVEEAIRASAPFGAQIKRRFGLFFSQSYKAREEAVPESDQPTAQE